MKCSGNLFILSFALYVIPCLVESKDKHSTRKRKFHVNDKHLLSKGYNISTSSGRDNEDTETSAKRSSTVDVGEFSAVNIPVPFHRVRYAPIHVAKPVVYSKKPDVLINHVHVHNGG